jgi:hypothetical protein
LLCRREPEVEEKESTRRLWWSLSSDPDLDLDLPKTPDTNPVPGRDCEVSSRRVAGEARSAVARVDIGENEDTATLARLGNFFSFTVSFPFGTIDAAVITGDIGVTNSIITSVESAGKTSSAGTVSPSVRVSLSIFRLRLCASEVGVAPGLESVEEGWIRRSRFGSTRSGTILRFKSDSLEGACLCLVPSVELLPGRILEGEGNGGGCVLNDWEEFGELEGAVFGRLMVGRGLGFLGGGKSTAENIAVGDRLPWAVEVDDLKDGFEETEGVRFGVSWEKVREVGVVTGLMDRKFDAASV